jgi:hypothetical protein
MAKKDIITTSEGNKVGSRTAKDKAHKDAVKALEKAKSIPRKAVFLKQGESQFSRELNKIDDSAGMLNSKDAAIYLNLSYNTFSRRQSKTKIPFVKRHGNKKYFKISDLDRFKSKLSHA